MDNDINVCFAQDSIVDLWYPAGNGNLMNILDNGIHLAQLMREEDFENNLDLITYNGAKSLYIQDEYGFGEGKPANFIVLDAIRNRAECLSSVRNGEFLFKKAKREFEVPLSL